MRTESNEMMMDDRQLDRTIRVRYYYCIRCAFFFYYHFSHIGKRTPMTMLIIIIIF